MSGWVDGQARPQQTYFGLSKSRLPSGTERQSERERKTTFRVVLAKAACQTAGLPGKTDREIMKKEKNLNAST
jgi:hypothetical protein